MADNKIGNGGNRDAQIAAAIKAGADAKTTALETKFRKLSPEEARSDGVPKKWNIVPFRTLNARTIAMFKGLDMSTALGVDPKYEVLVNFQANGKKVLKVYDPNLDTSHGEGQTTSPYSHEYPAIGWYVVEQKPRAPVDPNAESVKFTQKLPMLMEKFGSKGERLEAMMHELKLPVPGPNADPKQIWKDLIAKDQGSSPTELSELDKLAFAGAAFAYTKDGVTDMAKVADKAPLVKGMLLAVAERNIDANALTPEAIGTIITDKVKASGTAALGDVGFDARLEKIAGRKFVKTSDPIHFGNGKNGASLNKRIEMINSSKFEVDYDVWKMAPTKDKKDPLFDTGSDASTRLKKALIDAATGADGKGKRQVRVMVDGNVAARDEGSQAVLGELKQSGVQVLPFFDKENQTHGMHSKGLYVDASVNAINAGGKPMTMLGGRNAENEYMVDGRWSDSDHYFEGAGAAENYAAHAKLWNHGAKILGLTPIGADQVPGKAEFDKLNATYVPTGDSEVLSFSDIPSERKFDIASAMATTIGAASAGDTIHLEQAYFFGVPGIEDQVIKALKQGAKINLYTNSSKTTDLGQIADLSFRAVASRLYEAAPDKSQLAIKLYKGPGTMHDKLLVVESPRRSKGLVLGGSFNPHGRLALESENMYAIRGQKAMEDALANLKAMPFETPATPPGLSEKEQQMIGQVKALGVEVFNEIRRNL